MTHRRSLLLAAVGGLAAPGLRAQGAEWPSRTVRVIVGFPPGGSVDVLTRILTERMQARTAQAWVVENRPGAGGNISAEALARPAPDGHTIAMLPISIYAINRFLYARLPFDPDRDLVPASLVWDFPNVAVVPERHVPARDIASFVAWAKARPGGISYGSSGVGTTIHLSGALFAARNGIEATHVPFRGAAQTIPAMLSGDIHFAIDGLASYMPVIQEGKVRALAITADQRWPTLPEVPTMAETGVADFVVMPWSTWSFPAGTPPRIVARLAELVRELTAGPEMARRAIEVGARWRASTPEETRAFIQSELPRWQEMVRISGARVE